MRSAQESNPLLTLQKQFDGPPSRLDRHGSVQRVQSAFDATPEKVGKMATPLVPRPAECPKWTLSLLS